MGAPGLAFETLGSSTRMQADSSVSGALYQGTTLCRESPEMRLFPRKSQRAKLYGIESTEVRCSWIHPVRINSNISEKSKPVELRRFKMALSLRRSYTAEKLKAGRAVLNKGVPGSCWRENRRAPKLWHSYTVAELSVSAITTLYQFERLSSTRYRTPQAC